LSSLIGLSIRKSENKKAFDRDARKPRASEIERLRSTVCGIAVDPAECP
jgi:hypothetical protein